MKTYLTLFLLNIFSAFSQQENTVLGIWQSERGGGRVEIYKTGDKYFGKIIWLKEPVDSNGKPLHDIYNPNTKLRSQPIIGLEIFKNLQYKGNNSWGNGTVYNPTSGKSYNCSMWLVNKDKLNIRGYMGLSLIGKTETWTRVAPGNTM